jgi:hypothetical protein
VKTVVIGKNRLFKMFHPFVIFELIQDNVLKRINTILVVS